MWLRPVAAACGRSKPVACPPEWQTVQPNRSGWWESSQVPLWVRKRLGRLTEGGSSTQTVVHRSTRSMSVSQICRMPSARGARLKAWGVLEAAGREGRWYFRHSARYS